MDIGRDNLRLVAFYLAFGSAVATLFSIAFCQILLGAAFLALLVSRERLRMPPVKLPLALFILGTLISLAFSPDPMAGLPQIRKFYVLLTLPVIYTAFRGLEQVSRLVMAWIVTAAASASLGLVQLFQKWLAVRNMGADESYRLYIGERMTGFMSHWQTFGGELMLIFLLLAGFLFFSVKARSHLIGWLLCATLIAAGIVLGFTRNIWLGSFVGGLYLLWFWRRKLILLVPVFLVLVLAFGPASLRARFISVFQPHGEVDSNQHRIVTYRTGLRMIQANPLLGLGPEHVGIQFEEYVPEDVPRPLPEGWYGHLHNIYLHYAAERGIPTMLCLLWVLGVAIRDFSRTLRRDVSPAGAYYLRGAIAGILAILGAGFFELNLGDSEVLTLFLAIIACGYVIIDHNTMANSRRVEHG